MRFKIDYIEAADIEESGDKFIFKHIQDLDPTFEEVLRRKQNQLNNGFSEDRTQRYLGTVPTSVFALHPEFIQDLEALVKWMNNNPTGQRFLVNKADTGRSGKAIVK